MCPLASARLCLSQPPTRFPGLPCSPHSPLLEHAPPRAVLPIMHVRRAAQKAAAAAWPMRGQRVCPCPDPLPECLRVHKGTSVQACVRMFARRVLLCMQAYARACLCLCVHVRVCMCVGICTNIATSLVNDTVPNACPDQLSVPHPVAPRKGLRRRADHPEG